jgi:hypothetical protein
LNFISSIFLVPVLTVLILMQLFVAVWLPQQMGSQTLRLLMPVLLGPFIILFFLAWLFYTLVPIGRFLFSYLKISQHGLEYRYWPFYGLRCAWNDVDRLGTYRSLGFIPREVLYLKRAEPIRWQATMKLRQILGLSTQYFIPLTGIKGWPDGELANELRQRMPHLFDEGR